MTHEKRKRLRHCCRNILHETYLIKFKFEKLCEVWKTDILPIIAELLPTPQKWSNTLKQFVAGKLFENVRPFCGAGA